MLTIANEFALRGYSVDLVLVKAEGPYLSEVSEKVQVIDLDKGRVLSSLLPLIRYLRRSKPDVMLSALNHANIIAISARKLARFPLRLVVSERDSLSSVPRSISGRAARVLMRHFYPSADCVVAVSNAMAQELIGQIPSLDGKIEVVPNPVDVVALRRLSREVPDHGWLHAGQSPLVLAAGRLEAQKDFSTLISAFALLTKERDAKLVILGEGSQKNELELQVARLGLEDTVSFEGFQTNPYGWMACCSVFVLSSRHEGFPNVLVQAMACGARVVSTNCPTGPSEILDGGRWGRLVPVGEPDDLSRQIAFALDDENPPNVAKRAESYATDKIMDLYSGVLKL